MKIILLTKVFSLQKLVLDRLKKGQTRYEHSVHAFDHEEVPNFERSLNIENEMVLHFRSSCA